MGLTLTELDQGSFDDTLNSEQRILIVQFYTDTCKTCHALERVSEELAEKYSGRLAFTKVNAGKSFDIAMRYNVLNVPSFKIFRGGEQIGELVGSIDSKRLRNTVNDIVNR